MAPRSNFLPELSYATHSYNTHGPHCPVGTAHLPADSPLPDRLEVRARLLQFPQAGWLNLRRPSGPNQLTARGNQGVKERTRIASSVQPPLNKSTPAWASRAPAV